MWKSVKRRGKVEKCAALCVVAMLSSVYLVLNPKTSRILSLNSPEFLSKYSGRIRQYKTFGRDELESLSVAPTTTQTNLEDDKMSTNESVQKPDVKPSPSLHREDDIKNDTSLKDNKMSTNESVQKPDAKSTLSLAQENEIKKDIPVSWSDPPSWDQVEITLHNIGIGRGGRRNSSCPSQSVAIIIPYRDRPEQLRSFLVYIHPYLMRKNITYQIFVVEQDDGASFSRGGLFNIGSFYALGLNKAYPNLISSNGAHGSPNVTNHSNSTWYNNVDHVVKMDSELHAQTVSKAAEAERILRDRAKNDSCLPSRQESTLPFDCLIFHDVDLLPVRDHITYECNESPTHITTAVNTAKWKVKYPNHFGGVCSITPNQFLKANGYSNVYFGWGSEDDDISERIRNLHMSINQPPNGRYVMMTHEKEPPNPIRKQLQKIGNQRNKRDGMNSLIFEELDFSSEPGYTKIKIRLDERTVKENAGIKM